MEFIEISAKTVDDAITKACLTLETSSDNLEIQVVREGSSGFLGFGSKPAIIKARRKEIVEPVEEIKPVKPEVKKEPKKEFKKEKKQEKKQEKPKPSEKPPMTEKVPAPEKKEYVVVERTPEEIKGIEDAAREFLDSVFKAMEVPVEITIVYQKNTGNLDIDFSGADMGMLIGKRGQTLDSLQYLTSLVVNKGQEHYIRVKLDTENYRSRRKDTLENLAKNIAYKVRKTRKPVALEPMNPYERRIIHSVLQGNKYVETYSEGSEPYRHVVVTLKK
ncbi:RNA-binding cell elongation regulator Jag/EloR [Ruminococcus gauvreauii]|uniref:RNA-binding protein KhpB n=1 Tax=Ruminococcus gauvreauii TaxID=438033 RepID=A0ABY5VN38_9FIRM|nr:RNA-binding cell elongation regulator Jag/EloR [Ruminococcus gauvreauii]UWP61160.1 protein jag [Ruminococcus gauvreauii]